jgi:hypothetical protein
MYFTRLQSGMDIRNLPEDVRAHEIGRQASQSGQRTTQLVSQRGNRCLLAPAPGMLRDSVAFQRLMRDGPLGWRCAARQAANQGAVQGTRMSL